MFQEPCHLKWTRVEHSVTLRNTVGHVQIVILIWLLLSKEIVKIVYIEKTDSIWEWHTLVTFLYLHNCCNYKKNNIQFFRDTFYFHYWDYIQYLYSVTFCNMIRHAQKVILIWFLLYKKIVRIVYIEKTDSIWEWHISATFVCLHNFWHYKKNHIQFFADIFQFQY